MTFLFHATLLEIVFEASMHHVHVEQPLSANYERHILYEFLQETENLTPGKHPPPHTFLR